jgi:predicted transcriptional regulator
MVRTGREQIIKLPPAIDPNAADANNHRISRAEEVKTIAKRRLKIAKSLKKTYATLYDQCLQEIKDKLKATGSNWTSIQRDQSLHKLINKIERICVGFDDHKQEVFNLVQALKTLFLYSQSNKETVEQYKQNFRVLWEMVEAFGGSPGIHEGMIDALLKDNTQVAKVGSPMTSEKKKAQEDATESVKAALLISGADKMRFGKLKDELDNNYLLGTDQYPDTFKKAMRILRNY